MRILLITTHLGSKELIASLKTKDNSVKASAKVTG